MTKCFIVPDAMSAAAPQTPCVGLCSTVYGDVICRGCKRFHHEVIGWNGYSGAEKQAVLQRLERLLAPLVERRFQVVDRERLRQQLLRAGIRFCETQSACCWVLPLLSRKARQMVSLQDYGLALQEAAQGQSLVQLYRDIEAEFFALSGAYYQRYHGYG